MGRGIDREFRVSRCKLLHLEWISSEVLQPVQGTLSSLLSQNMTEDSMRKRIHTHTHTHTHTHIFTYLGHYAVQQKLTQHCKSNIL